MTNETTPTATETTALIEDADRLADLKARVEADIRNRSDDLLDLSHSIHSHPEIAWEEHFAAAAVADAATRAGFTTTLGAYGVETAVEAIAGEGDLTIAILAEYDALPEIGHACGHNIIATAAVGAAAALATVADAAGLRIKLLGTPAEESGGGKVALMRAGAFEDVAATIMIHPSSGPDLIASGVATTAVERVAVTFIGKETHAAGGPQLGINALSAATLALTGIGLARQHFPVGANVNAIITEGGQVTNVITGRSVVVVEFRAYEMEAWRDVKHRVLKCFEGAAIATGCTWSYERIGNPYAPIKHDLDLASRFDANLTAVGRPPLEIHFNGGGSSDLGNVSQVMPAAQAMISVLGSPNAAHNAEWTEHTATPAADRTALDGATIIAWTALDAALDPQLRDRLLAELKARPAGATMVSIEP